MAQDDAPAALCICRHPLPAADDQPCTECGRCRVCVANQAVAKGRCRACYQYRRRNGHDRPPHLIAAAPWHPAARTRDDAP